MFARVVEEFTHNPVEVLGAAATIALGLSAILQGGQRFWKRIWAAIRSKPFVPSETVRVVQDLRSSFWAHGGRIGVGPAMQVNFDGHITDISGREVHVLRVEIEKPATSSMMISISNKHDGRRPQFLRPHETADIRVTLMVEPVVGVEGKPWTATLIFIDQYGNRHKVKNCVFRGIPRPQPSDGK